MIGPLIIVLGLAVSSVEFIMKQKKKKAASTSASTGEPKPASEVKPADVSSAGTPPTT